MKTIEVSSTHAWVAIIAIVAVLLGGAYGTYRYYVLNQAFAAAVTQITQLQSGLDEASSTNSTLNQALNEEQNKNDDYRGQIDDLNDTVDDLDKLANTDPQLLAKYSKVYFLNENYTPAKLSKISSSYTFPVAGRTYEFLSGALPHLEDLMDAANDDDIDLQVLSSYRSFGQQATLKSSYTVTYGSGANSFSAEQGYSEHQLGTAADFTTPSLNGGLDGFDKTPAYTWLTKNAYRYGFILSYPPGNSYYVFEPWHWRYVGEKLARDLHNHKENFYDLDQREINTYLIDFF